MWQFFKQIGVFLWSHIMSCSWLFWREMCVCLSDTMLCHSAAALPACTITFFLSIYSFKLSFLNIFKFNSSTEKQFTKNNFQFFHHIRSSLRAHGKLVMLPCPGNCAWGEKWPLSEWTSQKSHTDAQLEISLLLFLVGVAQCKFRDTESQLYKPIKYPYNLLFFSLKNHKSPHPAFHQDIIKDPFFPPSASQTAKKIPPL